MPRRPPFPESLVDALLCLFGEFGPRHANFDRRLLGVTSERLRRPAPATIEQRICCSNSSVRSVALSHFPEQALDSLSRMVSGEFPDRCNAAWTAAGVTRLARCPSSVRVTHHLISACSEVTSPPASQISHWRSIPMGRRLSAVGLSRGSGKANLH